MNRCTSVQERLADEGAELIGREAAIAEHLAGCSDCAAFLEALKRVDVGMSRLSPRPAPRPLLARTAKAIAKGMAKGIAGDPMPVTRRTAGTSGERKLATSLAAMVVLAAGFGLVESVQQELAGVEHMLLSPFSDSYMAQDFAKGNRVVPKSKQANAQAKAQARATPEMPRQLPTPTVEAEPPMSFSPPADSTVASELEETPALHKAPSRPSSGEDFASVDESLVDLYSRNEQAYEQSTRGRKESGKAKREASLAAAISRSATRMGALELPVARVQTDADGEALVREYRVLGQVAGGYAGTKKSDMQPSLEPQAVPEVAAAEPPVADERDDLARRAQPAKSIAPERVSGVKDKRENKDRKSAGGTLADNADPHQLAKRFLAERELLTGLRFQPGSGYWANTYVPGDPAIRLLEARLQRWDRSVLSASLGDMLLEGAAHQNWQPFDVPENAALAAYLHADKRAVNGRSRLRVQVGLQGSQKRSGLRPDMNVGVVLDVRRPVDDATGTKLRALMTALARARQPGDRFSITVAGHPGGLLVAPEAFRNGPIRVAMQSLFTTTSDAQAPAMDLLAALHTASQSVRQGDDSSAPLGASLVLLVSTAPLGEQRESLERMVHENAVAGIGLSVVAVGGGADLASIDRLVLLGQGHRRVLAATEDAVKLVDRELHAASRAVARAVRLRIRLAPGVELIDVLGSKNLSEQAAQRVREAERSIDQRVARNIGIRADRGEDEEGIQIVIPSFFAGDSHAVLLDVVVPGPGPVADVSVRYKDLVYRRNGIARARLVVGDGRRDPGPLERNVLKNQLAHELARSASAAGQQLSAGDRRGAVRTLTAARELITGMRVEIPGWDNDNELRADEALLTQYLTALGSRFAGAGQHRHHLADSLRYLAFRRLIPPHK